MAGTILITGASGFVGRHVLTPLVQLGYEVHAVSRHSGNDIPGVHWIEADLLDKAQRQDLISTLKPTHLLHSAWYAEHSKFWHSPLNQEWLAASIDLAQQFAKHGGKRIVGVGSCAEYDWLRSDTTPWKESDPCIPATPYGQAKYAYYQELTRMGIDFAWARLFFMFGEDEAPARLVTSVILSLLKGQPARCTSGKQIRDFADSRDIGEALAHLMDSECSGAVNVASGQARSIADMTQMIATIMGKEDLLELGALPDRPDDPPYIVADTTKLREATGFVFPEVTIRIKEMIDWWREHPIPK